MIKEPIRNILGLKALAWDFGQCCFVSPARPDFVWSPGGLQASQCGQGRDHKPPDENCTCGLYASYDIKIIDNYTGGSPISPIFLVEASGKTVIHDYGWRSAEMSIIAVSVPHGGREMTQRLVARQASDYFGIKIVELETLVILMDVFNVIQMDYYKPYSPVFAHMSRDEILKLAKNKVEMVNMEYKLKGE